MEVKGDEEFLKLSFEDTNTARKLFGPRDENIKYLKKYFNVKTSIRGNHLTLFGEKSEIESTGKVVQELHGIVKRGFIIGPSDIDHAIRYIAHTKSGIDELQKDQILIPPSKKIVVPKTKNQKAYVNAMRSYDIVIGIGPAGTGKTYLAMAKAVSALQTKQVSRIILTRPAVEAGERLGFLPGTLNEKIDPYLRPLYDALHDMMDAEMIPKLMAAGVIEVAPLAFMRGRSLNDAFIILDEAQNTTPEQMKMFLTRIGFGSRAVVTGDMTQIDLPKHVKSGLKDAIEVFNARCLDARMNSRAAEFACQHHLAGTVGSDAHTLGVQLGHEAVEALFEQAHQAAHFQAGTLPVLGRKGENRQRFKAYLITGFDNPF